MPQFKKLSERDLKKLDKAFTDLAERPSWGPPQFDPLCRRCLSQENLDQSGYCEQCRHDNEVESD